MSRLVVFVEAHRATEEVVASVETHLGRMNEAIAPFLRGVERTWNVHRDRVTLRGPHFSANLVFVPRGIVLVADVPPYLRPFRGAIEERIRGALAAIAGNGQLEATRPEAASPETTPTKAT